MKLENYTATKMDCDSCIDLIKHLIRNGQDRLDEHLKKYGKVLLHIYASDELGNPLYELLDKHSDCISVNIIFWKKEATCFGYTGFAECKNELP